MTLEDLSTEILHCNRKIDNISQLLKGDGTDISILNELKELKNWISKHEEAHKVQSKTNRDWISFFIGVCTMIIVLVNVILTNIKP